MGDYSKLASMMSRHSEAAIFRRFDTLNVKNLLYMQAEIVHLEDQLHCLEMGDGNPEKALRPFSVYVLKEAVGSGENPQWTKYKEIQEKIYAYNDALLQYSNLRKIAKPTSNDLGCLRDWLERDDGGKDFLQGREDSTWKANEDFLSLDPEQAGRDSLTWLINEKMPLSNAEWDGVWDYHKDKLEKIANAISTLLAALLPSISILILYFVSKPASRLITISLFSVFFSLILTTVSAAKRVEVFAATTALAAVQVVFVSGGGLGSS
ncbi:MAG: hypothetical protein Q9186_005793 [Xanthomendoza sp. 1 TL-2023]